MKQFNLTNVEELFNLLLSIGQHPKEKSDTVTVMEKIGHFMDLENQDLFEQYKKKGVDNAKISEEIAKNIDVRRVLDRASSDFDGGYVMCGMLGHGDAFALRDPNGIRPAFWYADDEFVVVASERPALQTAFNIKREEVHSLDPGHAMIIKKDSHEDIKR